MLHVDGQVLDLGLELAVALDLPLKICSEVVQKHRMNKALLFYNESSLFVERPLKLVLQPAEVFNHSHHVLLQHPIPSPLFLDFALQKRYFNTLLPLILILLLDDLESLVVA